jgi:2-polyprenyl-3-methyl-5-hydroxy-6-metoxy-1,4-benzoquinol methylase
MPVVIDIPTCSVCGSSRFKSELALPISDFLRGRSSNYRLEALGLTGSEIMGYVRCLECSFVFASPTLDSSFEDATYNDAKADQIKAKHAWMSDKRANALYQTHHKWVDLNPFVLGLGFHFQRYRIPRNMNAPPIKLLDIGCGFGHTLELARVFGLQGTGCDLDQVRIAACREKGLHVVEPAAIEGKFDVIISSNVIEHVYDLRGYIGMVNRHLADGGVFVFNGLERSVIALELKHAKFKLLHPIEHRNVLTRRSLSKLLGDCGLRFAKRTDILATMKQVRSKAPLYAPYLLRAGFVSRNGVFSAIARRSDS